MSQRYCIAVNNKIIQFTEEENNLITSNEGGNMWNAFYNACKREFIYFNDINKDYLKKNGVEHIKNVLTNDEVIQFKQIWEKNFSPLYISRNNQETQVIEENDPQKYSVKSFLINGNSVSFVMGIISKILTLSLTKKIEAFYDSHFSINHILFSEALPDSQPLTSFRWHCDGGPDTQLHIMVYLDSYEETEGRTEFLNYNDTQKAIKKGYDLSNPDVRTTRITDFLPTAKIISPKPAAGDILIFNATRKSRKVMTLIIQPDFLPWAHSIAPENLFTSPVGRYLLKVNPFFPYYKVVDV